MLAHATGLSTLLLAAVFALPTPLTSAEPAAAQEARVAAPSVDIREHDERLFLRFADEGEALEDFVRLASTVLDVPVKFDPQEVRDVRMTLVGDLSCEREDFRDLFDRLLLAHGFLSATRHHAGGTFLDVRRIESHLRRDNLTRFAAGAMLEPERLDERPAVAMPTYTTVFPLAHADARALMAVLNPMVDSRFETLRSLDHGALMVTATLDTLRSLRDVILALDDAAALRAATGSDELQQLRERVGVLEAKLARILGEDD